MEIRNLANYRIRVGDKSIAPNASVSMPYDDYLSIAMGNDLSALPISVSAYESGLATRPSPTSARRATA